MGVSLSGVRGVAAARSHLSPKDVTEVRRASGFRPRTARTQNESGPGRGTIRTIRTRPAGQAGTSMTPN